MPPSRKASSHTHQVNLPYFDYLLSLLSSGNTMIEDSFGRHVHWGYWKHPNNALLTTTDFAQATENLSRQVCMAGKVQDNQKILDVGCGFGGTIAHINDNHQGMALFGLNLDARQLRRATDVVNSKHNNLIHFIQGNACNLPFSDNSIDTVMAVECIFHFPDREAFFLEAFRVLRPGGYLAISDFIPDALIQPLSRLPLPEAYGVGFYGKCNVQFTTKHYRQLALKTGFKLHLEDDITVNTLPTYSYLRRLANTQRITRKKAFLETAAIEILSRLRLIRYYIYGFQKPEDVRPPLFRF